MTTPRVAAKTTQVVQIQDAVEVRAQNLKQTLIPPLDLALALEKVSEVLCIPFASRFSLLPLFLQTKDQMDLCKLLLAVLFFGSRSVFLEVGCLALCLLSLFE